MKKVATNRGNSIGIQDENRFKMEIYEDIFEN